MSLFPPEYSFPDMTAGDSISEETKVVYIRITVVEKQSFQLGSNSVPD